MNKVEEKVTKTRKKVSRPATTPSKKEVGFAEWLAAKKKLDNLPKRLGADRSAIAKAKAELDKIEAEILRQF